MKNIFNTVLMRKPRRNVFDLSHDNKLTLDMGRLVPIYVQEVLPSDKFTLSSDQVIRFAPMLAPIMHKIDVYTHYFFVPNRILWDNWEKFITGSEEHEFPYIDLAADADVLKPGSLGDYLGIPTGDYSGIVECKVNALPVAAYIKIWYDYYRDQNLQATSIGDAMWKLQDGDNYQHIDTVFKAPFYRCWEHDYFTSALPFPQKGDEVLLPLQGEAPIQWKNPEAGEYNILRAPTGAARPETATDGIDIRYGVTGQPAPGTIGVKGTNFGGPVFIDNSANLEADLTGATQTTINELRKAYSLQSWLEKNARGGTRYVESLLVHFGVRSSDARLQRPEYLGGGKSTVMISEVLQTSATDLAPDTTPQGTMSGHGVNVGSSHSFTKQFEEHGFIIGIMSVMPKTAYMQGLPRIYKKFDYLDYYFPSFAHLGEQEVKNYEVDLFGYALSEPGSENRTFGYLPRYQEYRFRNSEVHGDFRESLDFWHLARKFEDEPYLNASFVEARVPKNIFAVQDPDVHSLYAHVWFNIKAVRPLPRFGIPSL